jgi:hypothetical protein
MAQPRKLALMLLFGFEADTLEIHLRELHDLVDVVFLVEAARTHRGASKPLMWERLKMEERFLFLEPGRVEHVVAGNMGEHRPVAGSPAVSWW